MEYRFFTPWYEFLPRAGGHVVGFCGGGGKSTLIAACVEALGAAGTACAVTAVPPGRLPHGPEPVAPDGLPGRPGPALRIARGDGALPAPEVDRLAGVLPDHVVLVELDRSEGRALRRPGAGDPRWPRRTSLAVLTLGVGAVGSPAEQAVGSFAPDMLPGFDLERWTTWEWEHQSALLARHLDLLPAGIPAVLALTGVDLQPDGIGLFAFVDRAMSDPRLPIVLFAGREEGRSVVRAACRAGEPPPSSGVDTAPGG